MGHVHLFSTSHGGSYQQHGTVSRHDLVRLRHDMTHGNTKTSHAVREFLA